jgi:pSer/pThr/pTyr-binding forkhead associated (FHA) protein
VSGTDIFLSYSREDRAAVRHIAESFEEEGLAVWWDAALQSGQTFDEVIEQRLKEAKAVVVLWSPRSVTSRWVRAEATLADRKNKLVPAIIEPCDRPIAFELTHTADLSEWTGDTRDPKWRAFVKDVQALVQKAGGHEAAAPAAPKPHVERVYARRPAPVTPPESPAQPRSESDDVVFVSRARPQIEPPVEASTPAPQPRVNVPDENEEVHALRVSDGIESHEVFIVGPAGLKIGRTAPADAVLSHPSVSRQHCVIGLANDELLVTDLSSTNGTFIDDERVERAAVLPVGSTLRVGQVSLTHDAGTREEILRPKSGRGASRRGGMRPARLAIAP